jgi:hypothetical protein
MIFMEKGTVYKIYLNEENRKMLDGFKKLCGDRMDDNDIITAALNVMARDMKQAINKKGEIKVCNNVSPDSTFEDDISQGSNIGEERALEGFYG